MSPKSYVRVFTLVAVAILLALPGFSQRGGTQPPTGGTTSPGTPGGSIPGRTTPTPGTIPNQNPNTVQQPMTPTPIFLSGRVMLDDGTPPPETVVIERVCNGNPRTEGYTDSKGYFNIELGGRNQVFQDASNAYDTSGIPGMTGTSASPGRGSMGGDMMGDRRFMNCDIRANLPGFRSQVVSLATRRALDDPNLGTIFLHRVGVAEGRVISAISLAAPKDARKAYDKGMDSLKKKKLDDAARNFEKAVDLYPKYATAWCELGKLQAAQRQFEEAHKSFDAAMQADPKFLTPYLQLSILALNAKNWAELADVTGRAVKLDPFDYPQAFFFNSYANYNLKKLDAAEKSAREAEKLDTEHHFPKVSHLLGVILAQRQDYAGAAEAMRDYLKFAPSAPDAATVRTQLAEIEKITGQSAAAPQKPEQDK